MRLSPKSAALALTLALAGLLILASVAKADDLRARFIAATTDASATGGAVFSQDQAGCVYDRFAAKTDAVRTLGLVLAMEGQQRGEPDVPFMIQNQASYDQAVKVCGAEQ